MSDPTQLTPPAPARHRAAWKAILVLGALVTSAWLGTATAQAQDIPKGTVAYFSGATCPAGWTAPEYAKGMLILATTRSQELGWTFGTPLANQEDRQHKHSYFAYVSIGSKALCGRCSCCNNLGAAAGQRRVDGETAMAPTGLPFIQYLVCEKS